MRLISCYIDGFGKLNNMEVQFEDGINTFVQDNGWGKSTLAAFIRVMLYGFDGETKRNDIENERKRYRPWSGAAYGGELVFESRGRNYRVQRTFGAKKSDDKCVIYDEATHAVTGMFTDKLGEELFHVDSASFVRSMYIGQDDCRTWATDGISAKLGNIADSTDDISNYENARQILKNVINRQSPTKRTGELYRRKYELDGMREQVRELDGISAKLGNIADSTDDISNYENARQILKNVINRQSPTKRTGELYRRKYELDGMREQVRELDGIDRSINELNKNIREIEMQNQNRMRRQRQKAVVKHEPLKPESAKPEADNAEKLESIGSSINNKKRGSKYIMTGFCALIAALLSLGMWKFMLGIEEPDDMAMIIFVVCAGMFCVLGIYYIIRGINEKIWHRKNKVEEPGDAADDTRSDGSDDIYTADDESDMDEEMSVYMAENMRLGEYARELAELKLRRQEIAAVTASLADKKKALEDDLHRYELNVKAYELLGEARDTFAVGHSVPVMEAFDRYYECVTGEHAGNVQAAPDMTIRYREQGMYRDSQTLSSGLADILGVCVRVAIVDSMYQDEKPMLIMDDPFVNLDDRNMAGAKKFVEKISEKYQILYFTCSQNRVL